MATPWVIAWLALVSIIGLNGFAAGVVAILHAWRSGLRRGGRMLAASAFAGLLSGSSFVGIVFLGTLDDGTTESIWLLAAVFGFFFAVAMIVSVPGALLVTRKLEAPGDDYRAFE